MGCGINDRSTRISSEEKIRIKYANILLKHYTQIEILNKSGTSSIILKGRNKMQNRIDAIKAIDFLAQYGNKLNIENVEKDVDIIRKLDHEHILKIHETISIQKKDAEYFFIAMEYCENTLQNLLKTSISRELARIYVFQIIQGISYLHKSNIIHGNLNSNNIYLNGEAIKISNLHNIYI